MGYKNLEEMATAVDQLKAECLFGSEDATVALPPVAEQHYLVAICLLAQAVAALTLAYYARMR